MNNIYKPVKNKKYSKVEALYKVGTPICRIETLTGVTRKTIRIWLTAARLYKPDHNNNINIHHNDKTGTAKVSPEAPQATPGLRKSPPLPIIHNINKGLIDKDIGIRKDIDKDIDIGVQEDISKDIGIKSGNIGGEIQGNQIPEGKLSDINFNNQLQTLDNIINRILKSLDRPAVIKALSSLQKLKALDILLGKKVLLRQTDTPRPETNQFIIQFINNRDFNKDTKEMDTISRKAITVKAVEVPDPPTP